MTARARRWIVAIAASAGFATAHLQAATPLSQIRISPDITVDLGTATLNDEDVGIDNLAGTVTLQSIGPIPPETDLDGYAVRTNGDQLLSFDTTVVLPGGLTAGPADVVRYNGASYVLEFSGAAHGIPSGVRLDAVTVHGTSLLFSFDTTFDAGALHVEKGDLVLWDGAALSAYFNGNAAGVPPGLNLDAADYIDCNDHLLLSFDGSGTIGGVAFGPADVLEYDRVGNWQMAYQGTAQHAGWIGANLDAVHATVDLGPGPPAVFGQTIASDPDKVTIRWPNPVPFKAARGSFTTSASIGSYVVDLLTTGTGASFVDAATPAAGTGYWYLVRPWGCIQTSWQSTLGAEPGRDAALP